MNELPDLLDFSHDLNLRSWVESANAPECDFRFKICRWASFGARAVKNVFVPEWRLATRLLTCWQCATRGFYRRMWLRL